MGDSSGLIELRGTREGHELQSWTVKLVLQLHMLEEIKDRQ